MGDDWQAGLDCFKAYDIRGKAPRPLGPQFAKALGRASAEALRPRSAVIGHDARLSGPALHDALARGLASAGVSVSSLGLCGTEEIYNAARLELADLGIMVTGSHNPADENGFKIVRAGALPVSGETGLTEIRARMRPAAPAGGEGIRPAERSELRQSYARWLLEYSGALSAGGHRLKVVADAGNGSAGPLLREIMPLLDMDFVEARLAPDGTFPAGVPNPLLPENRELTAQTVRESGADLGLAWDGDFDRCFFYDENGRFIEGYYMVGLLAAEMLRVAPGAAILHDTRVYWNTRRLARENGGRPLMGRTGHAYMKQMMRAENAVYGGEMSAHHYFRDFSFCDSGMLPWLLLTSAMRRSGRSLAEMADEGMRLFPCSGEINRRISADPATLLRLVASRFGQGATHEDHLDGLNLEFAEWRFSLRFSNTEPLLRLNVESRGDADLLGEKTEAILALLDAEGGRP